MSSNRKSFGAQYEDDAVLAGVYPIVVEQTDAIIKNNSVKGKGAIAANYNSKVIVEDLNRIDTPSCFVKAIKNCWISYKDIPETGNYYTDQNSVINFPKITFSTDISKRSGGIVTFHTSTGNITSDNRPHRLSDIMQNAAEWSTHLINDGNVKTGIFWQENGKNSFFYKSGVFYWHVNESEPASSSLNNFGYEPITTPDSIEKYFPDVNGNNITINVVQGADKNIKFSNVKGQLNVNASTTNIQGNFTFDNISKLVLNYAPVKDISFICSNIESVIRSKNTHDYIIASYINYNTAVPNIKDTCKSSFIVVNDLYNEIENFSNKSNTGVNDPLYDPNMFVKQVDYVNQFITGYQTQQIYITKNINIIINNAVKYSLIRHNHNNIFSYSLSGNKDVGGIILNNSTPDNMTDNIYTDGIRSINGGFNYEDDVSLGLRRTTLNPIPLGTVMGWYQIDGKPEVPYGFYDLTENSEFYQNETIRIYVDSDDPAANSFNLDFMSLYKNQQVFETGYIEFDPQPIITNGNVRILTIIKYNHNVKFRNN